MPKRKPSVRRIKEADWVGLRLLYIMMATDVSTATAKEIGWCLWYYKSKYAPFIISEAFELLSRDKHLADFFKEPACASVLDLLNTVKLTSVNPMQVVQSQPVIAVHQPPTENNNG
jgi:hypothetical protein